METLLSNCWLENIEIRILKEFLNISLINNININITIVISL